METRAVPGSPAAKIALFRSLFRGRIEVYPRRFESTKSGKAGYSPVCGNEWVRGVCEKPRVKCADCGCQQWLPVTDEVVRWHLTGMDARGHDFVAGVYPMLLDERCWFLAMDFDGTGWATDAMAFLHSCRRRDVPAALERSRSGNGAHVWIFFTEAVPAALARKLGAALLTETMERRPELGMKSYDRMFPNQDTLPCGGFGNLIAMPLQKKAREKGHSVFVDDELVPHADQWKFLAGLARLSTQDLESMVREAEGRGRVIGVWMAPAHDDDGADPWLWSPSRHREQIPGGPMPRDMELVLSDQIYFAKKAMPPALRDALARLAAFQNPEFYRAQAMRLPVYGKPWVIACAEDLPEHIALPRGCLEEVHELLRVLKIKIKTHDERNAGCPLDLTFTGILDAPKEKAAAAMAAHDVGVLSATTAFGKTVLAAWMIARRVSTPWCWYIANN